MTWTAYDATINEERKDLILSYLDGWRLETINSNEGEVDTSSIAPFVTNEEFNTNSANKVITDTEIETASAKMCAYGLPVTFGINTTSESQMRIWKIHISNLMVVCCINRQSMV